MKFSSSRTRQILIVLGCCLWAAPVFGATAQLECLMRALGAKLDSPLAGPTDDYARIFSEALLSWKAKEGNFRQSLEFFLKKRTEISRKHLAKYRKQYKALSSRFSGAELRAAREDFKETVIDQEEKLLSILSGSDSIARRHFSGELGELSTHTDIFPLHPNFEGRSERSQELYQLVRDLDEKTNFFVPGENEFERRIRKAGKLGKFVPREVLEVEDQKWLIRNITLPGEKKPIPVMAIRRKVQKGTPPFYAVFSTFSTDVPAVARRLETLWNEVFQTSDLGLKRRKIAEFEWLFFVSNPTHRAGASLGDVLSTALQLSNGMTVRQKFRSLDFHALARNPEDYIEWRLSNWGD